MSEFDASSHGQHHTDSPHGDVPAQDVAPDQGFAHPAYPADYAARQAQQPDEPDDVPLLSTLDQLREVAAEEDDREPITVLNPRETIRLTLRTDLEQKQIQRWSNLALDRKDRDKLRKRGGQPNLTNLSPVVMYANAIVECCIKVEVWGRATKTWNEVINERTGEPLTFHDAELRASLGGLDAVSAVKRAFNGSEPALMTAGTRLIDASGFGDDDEFADELDGEADPTTAAV